MTKGNLWIVLREGFIPADSARFLLFLTRHESILWEFTTAGKRCFPATSFLTATEGKTVMTQSEREARFQAVEAYIKKHYVSEKADAVSDTLERILQQSVKSHMSGGLSSDHTLSGILDAVIKMAGKTFAEQLLTLMEQKGKTPSEIYAKAGITKQHFSKIKNNTDYKPTKETALAFAVVLHLSIDETKDLIGRAGFTLSPSSKRDLIVEYFIKEKIYDMDELNYNLDVRGFGTLTNRRNGI